MDFFALQLVASFVAGAFVVLASTVVAERFQNRWGGFIAAIPTTTLVSLAFIAWTQGVPTTIEAAAVAPFALAGSALFAIVFVKTALCYGSASKKIVFPLAAGLAAWLALAAPAVLLQPSLAASLAVLALVLAALFYSLTLRKESGKKFVVEALSRKQAASRALLGGTIISASVFAAKALGAAWGGAVGSLPAVFASSLVVLTTRNGAGFAAFFAKDLSFGLVANGVFLASLSLCLPRLGFVAGFAASYTLGLLAALAFFASFKLFCRES